MKQDTYNEEKKGIKRCVLELFVQKQWQNVAQRGFIEV